MTPDEALAVVSAACARMFGSLDEHRQAQAALAVLNGALHPAPPATVDGHVPDALVGDARTPGV